MSNYWMKHSKDCLCGCNFNSFLSLSENTKKTVSIVVGDKGAGKTSVINGMLSRNPDMDIDIILKDLDRKILDKQFLAQQADRVHVFNSASIHIDRQTMLIGFVERVYSCSLKLPFEHLFLEAAGKDKVEQFLQVFYLPQTRSNFEIGSVVAVLDAANTPDDLCQSPTLKEQVTLADYIVINKCQLAEDENISQLIATAKQLNPLASFVKSSDGVVNDEDILIADHYDQLSRLSEAMDAGASFTSPGVIVLRVREALDRQKTDAWIKNIYARYGARLLCGKGYFNIHGSDYRFDMHSLRRNFRSVTKDQWEPSDTRESLVVFMGPELPDPAELQTELEACIAENNIKPIRYKGRY